VLVAATDGVGTKLKIAIDTGLVAGVGIDLVAMCVNDLVCQGGEPLFFLDYFACGALNVERAAQVVEGIADGCRQAGAALIGGETAEMPGMYHGKDYDLAGFCVGVVEKERIIDGSRVQDGDVLLGLASSGPHSNGYSLIRKVIEVAKADLGRDFHGRSLGDSLLEPTRIYVKSLLALIAELPVSALAHITGGGIVENLPRVLPDTAKAIIHTSGWTRPPVFDWLQHGGAIADAEMYRTFNCGIGMIVCLRPEHADKAVQVLRRHGETVWRIGQIAARSGTEDQVLLSDS